MDITEFYQTFFDEADELLRDMEQHLLELDPVDPDSEQLNAIFRSAHSIKGGAATFGFTHLQNTTHTLENLLDKARHDELTLTPDIIDVFLDAKDVMASQLDAYKNDSLPDDETFQHICDVLKSVEHGVGEVNFDEESIAAMETVTDTVSESAIQTNTALTNDEFSHYFIITLNSLKSTEVDVLADELGLFGRLFGTEKSESSLKAWLGTNTDIDDICGVLCFVVDESQIEHCATNYEACQGFILGGGEPNKVVDVEATLDELAATVEELAAMVEKPVGQIETTKVIAPVVTPASAVSSSSSAKKAAAAKPKGDSSSIRVAVEKVDQLINLVGELVIIQSMLTQHSQQVDQNEYSDLLSSIVQLERNSRALQESVMSIRMMPMDYVFSRFPRMVRDIASKLGKKIELKVEGSSTELDKSLIERIVDPLNHLVRNSLDHGIEKPEVRLANGKSEAGTLTLSAAHQSGNICIEVRDDGAGLNRERILAKARSQGMNIHDAMTNDEVAMLIMAPGFSTAEVITDVSGRGVGMDVVKRNIQDMGGRIQIGFTEGKGTIIRILLPLTLAILDGMSVKVADDVFIVPLSAIISTLQPRPEDIYRLAGEEKMLLVRGEYLPLVELHQVFSIENAEPNLANSIALIIQNAGHRFALLVDKLVGQQQVVVKNIASNYRKVPGISAATIMGDGSVSLILDVAELQRMNNHILINKKQPVSQPVMH
ncbi:MULTISPECIES: chemotaxis protein CheA [Providencia]|uniref:Chemotaxis protein CheA n=2 Tax=Providencia rustigianii TaxID=158850 RepID=D1NZM6_9GAMM|nr:MULTISPECIES: chemotaxis protein CheA [Providencia]EFB73292.1 CheW-like protein [Providencia rustigianii DSM 4541]MTC57062.1 chemotaxis protein CheA [Providencia rustigianii]SPY77177.1 Chemotaxis protein CheA [Providencia rustigianii]SUC26528.1 Chemotaxis protein CheA [Providencia rustigianii]SUC35124.1 Chemotaxis protein CheA [Providencia rustigianii]